MRSRRSHARWAGGTATAFEGHQVGFLKMQATGTFKATLKVGLNPETQRSIGK